MATRTLTWTHWLREVRKAPLGAGFSHVAGYPVADVAARLDVDRSRVHQLLSSGALDSVEITTRKGTVAMTLVTEASLERYLADRTPDRNRQGYFAFATAK